MTTEDLVYTQTEAAFRALSALWTQSASPSLAIFIDPTLIDKIGSDLPTGDAVARYPLTALKDRFPPDHLPYLIHIRDAERSWLLVNRSVEQAVREAHEVAHDDLRPRSVCGWIINPGDPRTMARSLGNAALVIDPAKERWPLRYWDPRTIGHLPRALAPEQYAALRPCLGNWWFLNGSFRLAPATAAAPNATGKLPLHFHTEGWRALHRIGHINEVMRMAAAWGLTPRQELAKRVDEAMQRAEARGFGSDEDMRLFAVCALVGHPRFDEHPRVAQSISKARATGQSFTAAIAEYDDEFWAGLNDGRWLEQLQQGVTR